MWGLDVLTTKVDHSHRLLRTNQRSLSQPYLSFACQLNLPHMFKFQLLNPLALVLCQIVCVHMPDSPALFLVLISWF